MNCTPGLSGIHRAKTMSIKSQLRRCKGAYLALRGCAMAYKRWRYGLRDVDKTFYMAGRSLVASDLKAGPHSFLNAGCRIPPRVELGPYVMLAPKVAILGGDHRYDIPGTPILFSGRPEMPATVIEADAWIGYDAKLMAGVRIGRGAIIAAGAVVTKDVPAYEIHAGVPAKKIGERFPDEADRAKHETMLAGPIVTGELCQPKQAETD